MSLLCFGCVGQGTVRVVETLGRFSRIARPGFTLLAWPLQYFSGTVSLRVQQTDLRVTSKTSDDVFCDVHIAVQYCVQEANAYQAFYRLTNPVQQIQAFIFDTVRSTVPKLSLTDVFIKKEVIADAVRDELTKMIGAWGYEIISVLVTDIMPEASVRAAMNDIQAQQRLRLAAKEKAEAQKVITVKAAEAEAESKFLQGEGMARQRQAIVAGLRQSVTDFTDAVPGVDEKVVLSMMLMTQWMDAMTAVGAHAKSNAVFFNSAPAAFGDLQTQIQTAVLGAVAPAAAMTRD